MSFSIYHCGRCGSLFPAEIGHDEDRACGVCKQRPGTGVWPLQAGKENDGGESTGSRETAQESPDGKAHRASAKIRRGNLLTWVVAVWVLVMGSALWLHRHNSMLAREESNRNGSEVEVARDMAALLEAALPDCHRSLLGFLKAKDEGERLRFVADPAGTAVKMGSSETPDAHVQVDLGQVVRVGQELLALEGELVVRTRWQEGADGKRFDAVFRRGSGAWLLDWDHFVRFGDHSWKAFLSGEGPEEAEFRLLAKEIPSAEETERPNRKLRFELQTPQPEGSSETPVASQQLVVDRLSEEGLLLGAAFAANREGGGPFGGTLAPMEPEGLVRVRVIVKRIDFGGVRKFEVAKLIACHWISTDEPGFDLEKLKEDAFGPG